MGKKVLGTILLVGLGAVLTIGAIRAFGAPEEILPDDQKVMECIGTIDFDDLENTKRYKRVGGESSTGVQELFEFTLDENRNIEARIYSNLDYQTENNKLDESFAKTKCFATADDEVVTNEGFYILNYKVMLVEFDCYLPIDKDIHTVKMAIDYVDQLSYGGYEGYFGADSIIPESRQYINANLFTEVDGEMVEEICSVSFYGLKEEKKDDDEETKIEITNKVVLDLSYNSSKSVNLDNQSLLEFLDGDSNVFSSATINLGSEDNASVSKSKGGLLLTNGASITAEINTTKKENEFNRWSISFGVADGSDYSFNMYSGALQTLTYNTDGVCGSGTLSEAYANYEINNLQVKPETDMIGSINFRAMMSSGLPLVIYSITFWNETVVEAE